MLLSRAHYSSRITSVKCKRTALCISYKACRFFGVNRHINGGSAICKGSNSIIGHISYKSANALVTLYGHCCINVAVRISCGNILLSDYAANVIVCSASVNGHCSVYNRKIGEGLSIIRHCISYEKAQSLSHKLHRRLKQRDAADLGTCKFSYQTLIIVRCTRNAHICNNHVRAYRLAVRSDKASAEVFVVSYRLPCFTVKVDMSGYIERITVIGRASVYFGRKSRKLRCARYVIRIVVRGLPVRILARSVPYAVRCRCHAIGFYRGSRCRCACGKRKHSAKERHYHDKHERYGTDLNSKFLFHSFSP